MTRPVSPLHTGVASPPAALLPGADPMPVITAADQPLSDYLARPTQHVLDQLHPHRTADTANTADTADPASASGPAPAPPHPGGTANPIDPSQLISPVVNALQNTLGSGHFPGADPTAMLNGIATAFGDIAGPLQQAGAAVPHVWQGSAGAAAAAKSAAALANGAEVATQATGLQNSLSAATADVAQAQTQLIAIINEFMATLAAIGPSIIFPWGWAAVIAAAAHAVAEGARVMTQTQSSLAAHASTVAAIGTPVKVTTAPTVAASAAGAVSPLASALGSGGAMSLLSPLLSTATAGISPALSAVSMATGPAATAGASSATLAANTAPDPDAKDGHAEAAGKAGGAAGPAVAPRGGAGGAAGTPPSRITAPLSHGVSESTITEVAAGSPRPVSGGMPLGGGGMAGAPLAGAGQTSGGGAHTAASFLHTADQGGKLVGNRDTVAPPVIGEVDPTELPDIELRI